MKHRGSEIAVGAFVLAGLAIVLVGMFAIKGRGLGKGESYYIVYRNASTLEPGSAVKYAGLMVGRVDAMGIDAEDPSRIRVTIEISSGTPVTTAVVAKITRTEIFGKEYIDLRVGDAEPGTAGAMAHGGERLPPGSVIEASEAFDLQHALERFQEVVNRTDGILADVQVQANDALQTINRMLGQAEGLVSDDSIAQVKRTLDDLATTAATVREVSSRNAPRLDALLLDASDATAGLKDVVEDVGGSLDRMLPEIEQLTVDLRGTVQDLRGVIATADTTLGTLDVQQVNDMIESLEISGRNLAEFTREIKERPFRLLRKEKLEEKEFK